MGKKITKKELKERLQEENLFIEKRVRDFKSEPYDFLEAYCDRLNIWEEGAFLILERLGEIRQHGNLTKEQIAVIKKAQNMLSNNFGNIPKHPGYDKTLRKLLLELKSTHPHLK